MFKAIATGKNTNYGVEDEVVHLANEFLIPAVKHGWIKSKPIEYTEDGRNRVNIKGLCPTCGL